MKTIFVGKNDINKRVDNFLLRLNPEISRSLVYKLIRKKRVKVNDKRILPSYRFCTGDVLSFNSDYFLRADSHIQKKNDFLSV
jgi:23S rRNA pseudouridine955/2504/2580 synthase